MSSGAGSSRGSRAAGTRLAWPVGGLTRSERIEMGDATKILFLHTSSYLYLFNAASRERE